VVPGAEEEAVVEDGNSSCLFNIKLNRPKES